MMPMAAAHKGKALVLRWLGARQMLYLLRWIRMESTLICSFSESLACNLPNGQYNNIWKYLLWRPFQYVILYIVYLAIILWMKGRDYILVCMKKIQLLQIYLESSFLNKWCQLPCMVSGFVGKVIRICFAKAVPWLNGKYSIWLM